MRIAVIGSLLLILLLVGLSSAPAATAQQILVKPGGTYTIRVPIHKLSSVRLPEDGWEVRVYFYQGGNCYNTGNWWQSGSEWIYSGWYQHRYIGDAWSGESEDKTISIQVNIVNNPRPQDDIDHGMNNIPVPGDVQLRARLLIQDIKAELAPIGEGEAGNVTFTISGLSYRYQYTVDEYGNINIAGEGFEARIDQDFEGKYRLMIDQTISVSVSDSAPSVDVYTMFSPINVNLVSSSQVEPQIELPSELKIAIALSAVVAVVVAAAYLALRGRSVSKELASSAEELALG